MGFVDDISDYRSLAIVGLEKNTGKTECLNYILRRIKDSADRFALTSIGIDGEKTGIRYVKPRNPRLSCRKE